MEDFPMPVVTYHTENNLLIAQVSGRIDLKDRIGIRSEISQMCAKKRISKIIVDHRKSLLQMSTLDHYKFGTSLVESEILCKAKIVILLPVEFTDADSLLFSLTVASNRGLNLEPLRGSMQEAMNLINAQN
jgi:hypothetical protein